MAATRTHKTRQRILDVAERLFADRGIDTVSIRDITAKAKVNLAAVSYHFGTKDNLIAEVFERRIGPVSQRQINSLAVIQASAQDANPSLEAILEALFRPPIEQAMNPRKGGKVFCRLLLRCLAEPNRIVARKMGQHAQQVADRFNAALTKALPNLSQQDLAWRMQLLVGGLHQSLMMITLCRKDVIKGCVQLDPEIYIRRFVVLTAMVLRASLP